MILQRRPRPFPGRRGQANPFKRILIRLFVLFVFAVIALLMADAKTKPIIQQMALNRVNYMASKAINDAVSLEISSGKYRYEDLVHLEKDNEGSITALKTDMILVNQLKVAVTDRVLEILKNTDVSELAIPLGNIINGEMLSGRGPKIKVNIVPLGSASASFENLFTTAGINQTRHQIIMTVKVSISVLTVGTTVGTTVEAQVNVAETIIVGNIPGNYTYFEGENGVVSTPEEAYDMTH